MLGQNGPIKDQIFIQKRSDIIKELPIRNKSQLRFFARTIEDIRDQVDDIVDDFKDASVYWNNVNEERERERQQRILLICKKRREKTSISKLLNESGEKAIENSKKVNEAILKETSYKIHNIDINFEAKNSQILNKFKTRNKSQRSKDYDFTLTDRKLKPTKDKKDDSFKPETIESPQNPYFET